VPRSLLPPFTKEGLLPPGDYPLTLEQLARSMLVLGPRPRPKGWDAAWRRHLVQQFEIPVWQLWQVGITEIFADGSFVTNTELFPHYAGLLTDIPDEFGQPQEFPAAFRKTRITYRPKGIIRIIP
jgi:hypothetical protein